MVLDCTASSKSKLGRPRTGIWKACTVCGRLFYVSGVRKETALTCSNVCKFQSRKGLKHSEETRIRISASGKGKHGMRGFKRSPESIERYRQSKLGPKNPAWKGGLRKLPKRRPNSTYVWRKLVLQKDNYTCQRCGKVGGNLHADHKLPYNLFPEYRDDVDNGQTLCIQCHRKSPTWGFRSRKLTREDFQLDYQI